MPFLRAGFNGKNYDTGIRGWTRDIAGRQFAIAELRQWQCGDYFWYGERPKRGTFLAWGDQCVFGSWHGFDLPWEYQNGLSHCNIETREEVPAWKWAEDARRKLEKQQATKEARTRHHQPALFQ